MDLSLRLLADAQGAQGAFKDFGTAVTAAGAIVLDFSKQSVKAFAEAERVSKQLARAAGENTEAFEAQAEAMSRQFAINDESIKSLQTLALTYGTMPQHVGGAIEAVENWSTVTGKDAKSAMLELIKAVEAGTGTMDRGRISFDATGDSAHDMAAAIKALNDKFGGAAAADANTLEGRMRATANATDELKEAWGGFIAKIEEKTGILEKVSNVLRNMTDARAWSQGTRGVTWQDPATPGIKPGTPGGGGVNLTIGEVELTPSTKAVTNAAARQEAYLNAYNQWQDRIWVAQREAEKRSQQSEDEHDAAVLESKRVMQQFEQQLLDDKVKAEADAQKKRIEEWEKGTREIRRILDEQKRENEAMAAEWMSMGKQIGAAVINGIVNGLKGGGGNGKKRTEEVVLDVVMGIFEVVFNMLLQAVGGGFATGASSQMFGLMKSGYQSNENYPSQHTGGHIERFHGGGPVLGRDERMAVLQTGEHVLSRADVARAGGRSGIDAMRGGGQAVNIYAFDSSSLLDFFGGGRKGDRAMIDAARTGRGQMRLLFGGGRV